MEFVAKNRVTAAIELVLLACIALTAMALMAVFSVWNYAGSVLSAVRRKFGSAKESDWHLSPRNQLQRDRFCWICGKGTDLRTCKIDEYGMVVHENCYATKLALALYAISSIDASPTYA